MSNYERSPQQAGNPAKTPLRERVEKAFKDEVGYFKGAVSDAREALSTVNVGDTLNEALESLDDDVKRLHRRHGPEKVFFSSLASTVVSFGATFVAFDHGYNNTGAALIDVGIISAGLNFFSFLNPPTEKDNETVNHHLKKNGNEENNK